MPISNHKRIRHRRRLSEVDGDTNGNHHNHHHNYLYQISWEEGNARQQSQPLLVPRSFSSTNAGSSQQQQQQQPQAQYGYLPLPGMSSNNNPPMKTSIHHHHQEDNVAQNTILSPPAQELTLQDLNPFPETVWSYTMFLSCTLVCWILILMLPRGFRKQYCGSHRKRYAQRTDHDMPAAGYWLPASHQSIAVSDTGGFRGGPLPRRPHVVSTSTNGRGNPPILKASSTLSSMDGQPIMGAGNNQNYNKHPNPNPNHDYNNNNNNAFPRTPPRDVQVLTERIRRTRSSNHPPSPEHPALKKIPPNKVIAETMGRLQGRGIRLVAHGVHCDPKRVWILLDDDTQSVTWQTEFPRRVPNQAGQVSIVLMRGSMHRIALTNVLYIDVGKKTNALQKLESLKVPDGTCFSLLTQNGSLDLQANSKLERDALVSCFSMILDDVHANADWRALYEASPDPSLANSSLAAGGGGGVGGGQRALGTSSGVPASSTTTGYAYPNPSDLLVEV